MYFEGMCLTKYTVYLFFTNIKGGEMKKGGKMNKREFENILERILEPNNQKKSVGSALYGVFLDGCRMVPTSDSDKKESIDFFESLAILSHSDMGFLIFIIGALDVDENLIEVVKHYFTTYNKTYRLEGYAVLRVILVLFFRQRNFFHAWLRENKKSVMPVIYSLYELEVHHRLSDKKLELSEDLFVLDTSHQKQFEEDLMSDLRKMNQNILRKMDEDNFSHYIERLFDVGVLGVLFRYHGRKKSVHKDEIKKILDEFFEILRLWLQYHDEINAKLAVLIHLW